MINYSNVKTTKDFHRERSTQGQSVGVINLGCARNLIDAQTLLSNFRRQGHRITSIEQADVAVVNTCAFIEEAKKESIDTILDLLELKKKGKLKKVIVAGCLAQRYSRELAGEFKEIDAIVGAQRLDPNAIPSQVSLTPNHYAYVKICESCYNACSFCVIPKIKGKFVSRTIESVIEEVKMLDTQGVREINLIGQDITAYGIDLYREYALAKLLKAVVPVTKNIQWIRLLYAFPAHVTDELIDTIAAETKICSYIDMPLQHISDHILSEQNRNITTQGTYDLIGKIRRKIPQGSLRTTFIVGLPGETDGDFNELKNFVKKTKFEKAGTFVYSQEEGTVSAAMPGQIPGKVKRKRMDELMRLQQEISKDVQQAYLGRTLKCLVDEKQENEEDVYIGRSEYDAPEVDGIVYVRSKKALKPGDMVDCFIDDTLEYDLAGRVVGPES